MNIRKRDGEIVSFDTSKITNAIKSAMKEVWGDSVKDLAQTFRACKIAADIAESIGDGIIDVEQIQDSVEVKLMKKFPEVAKAYIKYRQERTRVREMNSDILNRVKDTMQCKNIQNSNANLDEYSFIGRKTEAANIIQKTIGLNDYIAPVLVAAHKNNDIYLHDLSEWTSGTHNCFGVETKFITSIGTRAFSDFSDGDEIMVLTHKGNWKRAKVKCYGIQPTQIVSFKKGPNGTLHQIRCTPNHRWILENGTETTNLTIGDYIVQAPEIFGFDFELSSFEEKLAWCKGFAMGDGTILYKYSKTSKEYYKSNDTRVRLCGQKIKYLYNFLEVGARASNNTLNGNDIEVIIPDYDKILPPHTASHEEINAFINGLYAADGYHTKLKSGNMSYGFQSSSENIISLIRDKAETVGLYISSERDKTGQKTNYVESRKYTIEFGMYVQQGYFSYRVAEIAQSIPDYVWCLEVEDDNSFVLSGGICTGNCLNADLRQLLGNGFATRNGDVRKANSFSTACQQLAVIFQSSSGCQFGGIASSSLDFELAPFVRITFLKKYEDGLRYADRRKAKTWDNFCEKYNDNTRTTASITATANIFKEYSPVSYFYAADMLEKEGLQSTQAMYHNLNTLESRGAQLPFSSINFGLDTTFEGRKVTEWCLRASIDGIGKHKQTPIFPISIFKYKKDVNDRPGTPNYDLKQLAIQSLCKRIYPK